MRDCRMKALRVAVLVIPILWTFPIHGVAEDAGSSLPATQSTAAAAEKVSLKEECGILEQVFRKRTALHYLRGNETAREEILKDLDPESANAIRRVVTKDDSFKSLDYHFLEKIRNCETRILYQLRGDRFQGIDDILEFVRDKTFPVSAVYATLLNTVEVNFRYALRKGLISDADFAKDVGSRLAAEALRVTGTAGHTIEDLSKEFWKDAKGEGFPAWWLDPSSGPVTFEFQPLPAALEFPTVDLNTASREDILSIPGVEGEIADAVLKYARSNGFQGPEELRAVKEVPRHLVEPLQTLCCASQIVRKKRWTVAIFLNAANNLEPCGIKDMNEMEAVGSTRDVNIVVELARMHTSPKGQPVNWGYLFNPYAEREPQYYVGLANEPGTRRYYVLKDDDPVRIRSAMKENVGPTDAGRPEPLVSFGRWMLRNYPAENYALVIWNHGAGWSGVSYDDNTEHGLDLPEVRAALEAICESLKADQNKPRIDVLEFDACLMATLEVGFELKDTVDYLVASQESEPGDGIPYTESLDWLSRFPEASPFSFSKALVEAYVRSYAPGGSQTEDGQSSFSETKSALRLSQVARLREAVEEAAGILLERRDVLGDVAEEVVGETRRFGRLVDIHDFFTRLAEHEKGDAKLKAAVTKVTEIIGYPTERYRLVNEVIIKRRSPGNVIWGFNGWLPPPRYLAPLVHQARFAKIPLAGPNERGDYVAHIRFPPVLFDPRAKKQVPVQEINYRFEDESQSRTIKDFDHLFITTDFAGTSPVCAEGHMVSNNRSHGVSLYFPAYLGFEKEYRKLRFAQDSRWADLIEKFPLKQIEKPKSVAILGIQHTTKAMREELGRIVVREEFAKQIRRYDFAAPWKTDLMRLGVDYDWIADPRPYGEDWAGLLHHWKDGVIILDNHEGLSSSLPFESYAMPDSPFFFRPRMRDISGPDGRSVDRYLQQGGRLLLTMPGVAASLWDTPLYRDTLGLSYGEEWDRSYRFELKGGKVSGGREMEVVPAMKGAPITTFTGGEGVEPLAVLKEGGKMIGAKIQRRDPGTGKTFRAIVLGFHLTDIANDDDRRLLLEEALSFLCPSWGSEGQGRVRVVRAEHRDKASAG